jgi:cysteine desulfurase
VRAYLDCNAGAPLRPEAASAMVDALGGTLGAVGNPSSVHGPGREARRRLEEARARVAALVGASSPEQVVFTSGGTEANALALCGLPGRRVLVSAVEHPSVLGAVAEAQRIPVDHRGVVDLAALERLLAQDQAALVSIMLANNETGVIQPVAEAARLAHGYGALLHCDAAQGPGRLDVSLKRLGADLMSVSAHKMGGPSGIGALVVADATMELAPILRGGGQERRRRAGTENLIGAIGFGAAAELARADVDVGSATRAMCDMRDRLEARARAYVPGAVVIGAEAERLPNTSCLALPGVPAQVQVMALDLDGVAVSAGSACSSGKVAQSHVLDAMGISPEVAGSAIRVSLGPANGEEDVDAFLAAWVRLARRKGFEVSDAAVAA